MKHESIRLLAESKLNSIIDLISKVIENGVVSNYEKQSYVMLKEKMQQRVKRIVNNIDER